MKPFNLFPYGSTIHFMRIGWISLSVAALLTLFSIGTMVFNSFPGGKFDPSRTFNYALDFTGGTVTELHFSNPVDVDVVRMRLEAAGMKGAQVQNIGSRSDLLVRLQTGHGTADEVVRAASTPDHPAKVTKSDFVGPQVGRDLAINGLYAVLFVILGLVMYVSVRFEFKFAIAAILATLHDVVVVCGWFAISGHEFDLNVLAGILAVMGFSINDTIVVFDRVRENFRSVRAEPKEIMNMAINQTLSRHHLVRCLPEHARALRVRWRFATWFSRGADHRRGDRYLVLDLHRLPAAAVPEREQAGPDAQGQGRSRAGTSPLSHDGVCQRKGRALRGLFVTTC
jgi:preprotein translocase subunit SecF